MSARDSDATTFWCSKEAKETWEEAARKAKPMTAQEKSDATAAARYLGSLAKGKPKRITPSDAKQRGLRLAEARKKRWAKKVVKQ